MKTMLDGDHYRTAELVDQLISNAQMKTTFEIIELLKPDLSIVDNNQGGKSYCYDYRGIIVSGGETLFEAMCNFQSDFFNKKP